MSILITGATGFIGSAMTQRCFENEKDVHVVVRPHSEISKLPENFPKSNIHVLSEGYKNLPEIIGSVKPEMVFHIASLFIAQHKPEDIVPLIESNVTFSTLLLEAMVQNGCKQLVNVGTSWQNFNNEDYNPTCLYAATKQAFEDVIRFYAEAQSLNCVTLRLFDTYGPNDFRPKLFSALRRAASSQQELAMSAGEQKIDLVYVDDVIDAFEKAAEVLKTTQGHKVFAVTSGNQIPLKDLVSTYMKVSSKEIKINWGERPYRDREVMVPWNKGETLPGWVPKVPLEEGLRRMENV